MGITGLHSTYEHYKYLNLYGEVGDTKYNACIGNNGDTSSFTYQDGYLKASEILLKSAMGEQRYCIDVLIYPILFNIRHFSELALKNQIIFLTEIDEIIDIIPKKDNFLKLKSSHDLMNIWSTFLDIYSFDTRYEEILKDLDSDIKFFGQLDRTGQTFRYELDNKDNRKHLASFNLINLTCIKKHLDNLKEKFINWGYLNNKILKEYTQGTFIKSGNTIISREIIENIGKEFLRDIPKEKSFYLNLRRKYNVSGNLLDKIIDKIKEHREFSNKYLKKEIPIEHLSVEALSKYYLCCYENSNPEALVSELERETLESLYKLIDLSYPYYNTLFRFSEEYDSNNWNICDDSIFDFLFGDKSLEYLKSSLELLGQNTLLKVFDC